MGAGYIGSTYRQIGNYDWVDKTHNISSIGIVLRRVLLNFLIRNIRPTINWDTISDDWIAGVQLTMTGDSAGDE